MIDVNRKSLSSGEISHRAIDTCEVLTMEATAVKIENESMENRVAQIIIEELKLEDVTPESFDKNLDLVDELGIDSMDLTAVVLVLQDEYSITIDEDDYPKLKNVSLIAKYIQDRLD